MHIEIIICKALEYSGEIDPNGKGNESKNK